MRGRKPWSPVGNLHIDAATIPVSYCRTVPLKVKAYKEVNLDRTIAALKERLIQEHKADVYDGPTPATSNTSPYDSVLFELREIGEAA